jgi:hypothetical protein
LADGANSMLYVFGDAVMPPKQTTSIKVRHQPGWITFSIDGRRVYSSTGEVIDARSKKIVATLEDETGRHVGGEKVLDIVFRSGKPIRAGDQFGLGAKAIGSAWARGLGGPKQDSRLAASGRITHVHQVQTRGQPSTPTVKRGQTAGHTLPAVKNELLIGHGEDAHVGFTRKEQQTGGVFGSRHGGMDGLRGWVRDRQPGVNLRGPVRGAAQAPSNPSARGADHRRATNRIYRSPLPIQSVSLGIRQLQFDIAGGRNPSRDSNRFQPIKANLWKVEVVLRRSIRVFGGAFHNPPAERFDLCGGERRTAWRHPRRLVRRALDELE